MAPAPPALAVDTDMIPDVLRDLDRWVLWKWEKRDGKWTKPPYQPNGSLASSTDAATWSSYDEAIAAYEAGYFAGIGFVLTDDDDLAGIDLDHCMEDGGGVSPWAWQIVKRVDSYAEVSPSGRGVRIICRGSLPPGRRKTGNIEMYDSGRYLTITGASLNGSAIAERQAVLAELHAEIFPPPAVDDAPPSAAELSDAQILDLARSAANGSNFTAAYNGADDHTDDGTPSAGDLSLLCILAFYTRDPAQLDRLFRGSPRMRDKWDRADYRQKTIDRALETVTETYGGPSASRVTFDGENRGRGGGHGGDHLDLDHIEVPGRHDSGNADLLAQLHGQRIRYVTVWNEWLVWVGTHWDRDTRAVRIGELAKDVGRTLITLAAKIDDSAARGKALSWANQSLGAGRIRNMIELARGIDGVPLDHELLDADPWLLGVKNGVVDLRTGGFRPADPADLMSMQCAIEWDDNATAPRWEAALEEWFPDPDTRAYVHRLVGQALVGLQRDHIFVIHYGTGGNGKGTFVRALQTVLGPYSATPDLALLTDTKWGPHDTATATLFRARLAVASETEKRVKLAEASIKNLTGGDRVSARRLYENPWAFTPTHTLWLTTNYQPQISGRDPGIWRRIRVVPWVASFTSTGDKTLDDKLRTEAAGILRWAVAGVAEWLKHDLDEPDAVIKATANYRSAEDLLGRFADDVGLIFGPDLSIAKTVLADLLEEWAKTEGITPPKTDLNIWLEGEHGCRDDREYYQTSDGKRRRRRIWQGVGFDVGNSVPPENTGSERGFGE